MSQESMDPRDRILLGACAAIWLVVLGAGVAATVALIDLGRGHTAATDSSETPWLLYTVIGISAVVIIAAVPLLIRARRTAMAEPAPARRDTMTRPAPAAMRGGAEPATEKLKVFGPGREVLTGGFGPTVPPAVDQVWVRCAAVMGCATGAATVLIAVATYLMAVSSDGAAWACFGVAGAITLALPAIPWFYLRQLRIELESGG
jgi:hypothetical protein